MKTIYSPVWDIYMNDSYNNSSFDKDKCGKWMYFFERENMDKVSNICKSAIVDNIVKRCKHSNNYGISRSPYGDGALGVACFYLDCDDIDGHKKVIEFFIENNLIKKTKRGTFYNISFKLDNQTRAYQYGNDYKGSIRLSDFINLENGMWTYNK